MAKHEEKGSETFISKAKDLEEANELRTHLLNSVGRIWLFVFKNNTGDYTITGSTQFGGKLSESMAILLRDCCKKFLSERVTVESEEINIETVDDLVETVGV